MVTRQITESAHACVLRHLSEANGTVSHRSSSLHRRPATLKLLSRAKTKLPHNLLTKWTKYTVKCAVEVPTLLHFQQWLENRAAVVEKIESCVVLDWIQSRNKLKRFVANRVDGIRQSTSPVDWRYVPTESNPADYGTRGLKPDAIEQKWTRPPPLMTQPPHKGLQRRPLPHANSICAAPITELQPALLNINRFSSWIRLLHSTSQVCRFIRRFRRRSSDRSLITSDFQRAQHLHFQTIANRVVSLHDISFA